MFKPSDRPAPLQTLANSFLESLPHLSLFIQPPKSYATCPYLIVKAL
jgi:hypothetical protein